MRTRNGEPVQKNTLYPAIDEASSVDFAIEPKLKSVFVLEHHPEEALVVPVVGPHDTIGTLGKGAFEDKCGRRNYDMKTIEGIVWRVFAPRVALDEVGTDLIKEPRHYVRGCGGTIGHIAVV